MLTRADYPFNADFYRGLAARRSSFTRVFEHTVPRGEGYGLRVEAGCTLRLVMKERPNMLDLCVYNADDPSEFYCSGAQLAIEGGRITRFTRIWGTPPHSRPLCTVIADTLCPRPTPRPTRDHASHAAHCSPHAWQLYTRTHPRTCYDNLRQGLAMLGLSQRDIHDNVNLFYKLGVDPETGHYVFDPSDAEDGDYIELYAELPLLFAVSICPYGDGTVEPAEWADSDIPVYPLGVEVYDTGVAPLGWP